MLKNNYFKYTFTLFIICFLSSGLLSFAYILTKPKIDAQRLGEEVGSLKEVLPLASTFKAIKDGEEIIYYKAFDEKGRIVGYTFKAIGKGYSSVIETMVGMKKDGTVTGIKVISQNETPGLGSRIVEVKQGESASWFQAQFKNKEIKKLDKRIQTITGATISSRTVINSIQQRAEEVLEIIANE